MKLFAAAVIVAAGYFLGGAAAEKRRLAYAQSCGILRLLYAIRSGIDYARADLFTVFASFSDPALAECGFMDALNSGAVPVKNAWDTACGRLSPDLPMISEIRSLGGQIGMSDAQTQIELISKLASQLELRTEEERRELRARVSSYRALGALMGCMAAIIIY